MSASKVKFISTDQKKLFILGAAGVFFVFVGWLMALQPALEKLDGLERLRMDMVKKADLIKSIEGLQNQGKELTDLLFTEADRHTILGKLTTLTHESGLEVLSMEPSEKVEESFVRIIVSFKVSANFKSLIRFLAKLETMKPSLSITQLRMQKNKQDLRQRERRYPLETTLTLEGLMKKV